MTNKIKNEITKKVEQKLSDILNINGGETIHPLLKEHKAHVETWIEDDELYINVTIPTLKVGDNSYSETSIGTLKGIKSDEDIEEYVEEEAIGVREGIDTFLYQQNKKVNK